MKITLSQTVALTALHQQIAAHQQEMAASQQKIDHLQQTASKIMEEAGLDPDKVWHIAPDGTATERSAQPLRIATDPVGADGEV